MAGHGREAAGRRAGGRQAVRGPTWSKDPAFFAVRQGYLAASQPVSDLLAAGAGDPVGDAKARFATGFLLDALAPASSTRPARRPDIRRPATQALIPGAWRTSATKHRGSWREDRTTWPGPRAGERGKPPPMGSGRHQAIADATGENVPG
jgi:hypothetical protein